MKTSLVIIDVVKCTDLCMCYVLESGFLCQSVLDHTPLVSIFEWC